jgi:predicted helicase
MLLQYQSNIHKNKNMDNKYFQESLKAFFQSIDEDLSMQELSSPEILILKSKNRYLASIETKNFDSDLSTLNNKSISLIKDNNNHIITNYREIDVYKKGHLQYTLSFLDEKGNLSTKANLMPSTLYTGKPAIQMLEKTLQDFKTDPLVCNKPSDLAIILAVKTKKLKDIVFNCLSNLKKDREITKLEQEFEAYKKLMPDLDISRFSDFYAQTITYGLFIVRYLNSVSQIGSSFLDEAFSILSSKKIDARITEIYDEIQAHLMQIDLSNIVWEYSGDVVIHFYETFLEHYDAKLRKEFGAWYTPDYVVDYQVKSTNALLKHIGYSKGYLDDINILDPATGTSNYLNSILKETHKEYNQNTALWNTLVNSKLLNNLYGFEIMMTPFIIAQMRLVETLRSTGFVFNENTPALNLFLTNSLDPPKKFESQDLFQYSDYLYEINSMSKKVLDVRNKKFACIIGNPPYNGLSTNRSDFINDLMLEYKPTDRNINDALNDDYLKFIRLAQHFIEQNKKGVISFITNNSFLKNVSYEKLRQSLLLSFDEIYIINLHGDQKNDENVFDITIGVAMYFLVKKSDTKKNTYADTYYYEIIGKKEDKKSFCLNQVLNPKTKSFFQKLSFENPSLLFIPTLESNSKYFTNSFNIDSFFKVKACGVKTGADDKFINTLPVFDPNENLEYAYHPMDNRYIKWCNGINSKSKIVTDLATVDENFYIGYSSSVRDSHDFSHNFVFKNFCDSGFFSGKSSCHFAPLYIPLEDNFGLNTQTFTHNFNDDQFKQFLEIDPNINPIDVMDYIYGVLNDQEYLKQNNQLLKLNYPRIPFPTDKDQLQYFVSFGASLRKIHLNLKPSQPISSIKDVFFDTTQMKTSIVISKVSFDIDRIKINDTQYFLATKSIWEYKIGASRPAKNWLESRIGQTLSYKDIDFFINILAVIKETLILTQSKFLSLDIETSQENTLF